MLVVRGDDGELFVLGDEVAFETPLRDTGDGFGWRAAAAAHSFWVNGTVSFEILDETVWTPVAPEQIYPEVGRVEFPRCLRHRRLRARGICRAAALAAASKRWELRTEIIVGNDGSFGDDDAPSRGGESRATLIGCSLDSFLLPHLPRADALVRLPFTGGAYTAVGAASLDGADTRAVHVQIDAGEVRYGPG